MDIIFLGIMGGKVTSQQYSVKRSLSITFKEYNLVKIRIRWTASQSQKTVITNSKREWSKETHRLIHQITANDSNNHSKIAHMTTILIKVNIIVSYLIFKN